MESSTAYNQQENCRKARPQPEQALKCPRCESTNTKFCYYNNYSLSQPRYFCKGCRRYWTHGGSLRNVPVGGGCRKNRRSSSSSSSNSKKLQDHQALVPVPAPTPIHYLAAMDNHVPFFLGNTNSNTNNLNFVEHSGMENVFFGFGTGNGSGEMVLGGATSAGTASGTSKVASQWLPWQVGDADHVSLGLDTGRECWNNGVGSSSSWQGLINSSLM